MERAGVLVLVASAAAVCLSLGAVACSSTDAPPTLQPSNPGGCQAYVPPQSFSPLSPIATFSADVMPILTRSCGFGSCHGSANAPTGGMYLGVDAVLTYANIVGVPSNDVPTMARVQPGAPATSFLQHKIDGDACTVTACDTTCAESMPQGQDLMAVTDRLTIRAWIAQGAASDLPPSGSDGGATTGP